MDRHARCRTLEPTGTSAATRLESAAIKVRESVVEPWRSGATVEVGRVDQSVERRTQVLNRRRRSYTLIAWRGGLLALRGRPAGNVDPGTGGNDLAIGAVADWPVVLSPSALLVVVEHCLGLASSGNHATTRRMNPRLTVIESAWSPYPPQSDFVGETGAQGAGARFVVVAGRIRRASSRIGWGALAIRPDLWSRPSATQSLPDFGCRIVEFASRVRRPDRAVVLHSLTALSAGGGVIDFEADLLLSDRGRSRPLPGASRRVRFDPRWLLSRILGALGRPVPALCADPISGDRYGMCPWVLTDLKRGDMPGADR